MLKKMTYMKLSLKHGLFLLSLLVLAASCKTLKTWDSARENFSKGAIVEMTQRTQNPDNPANSPFANLGELYPGLGFSTDNLGRDPMVHYRQSHKDIMNALEKTSKLRQAGELGNALTIKALAEWKIDSVNQARKTAAGALQELLRETERDPRDEALMEGLSGLITIDECFESVQAMIKPLREKADNAAGVSAADAKTLIADAKAHYLKVVKGADNSLEGAIATLESAKQRGAANKEIVRYLLLSQLAALNSWVEELNAIDNSAKLLRVKENDTNLTNWIKGEWTAYEGSRKKHLDQLAGLLPGGKEDPGYLFWKKIL